MYNQKNTAIVTEGDMSGSLTSTPINLDHIKMYAIQAVVSSGTSPSGALTLEASCDPSNTTPSTWTEIGNTSQTVTADGSFLWNVENAGYNWVRLVYTRTSGSGTLDTRIQIKG